MKVHPYTRSEPELDTAPPPGMLPFAVQAPISVRLWTSTLAFDATRRMRRGVSALALASSVTWPRIPSLSPIIVRSRVTSSSLVSTYGDPVSAMMIQEMDVSLTAASNCSEVLTMRWCGGVGGGAGGTGDSGGAGGEGGAFGGMGGSGGCIGGI